MVDFIPLAIQVKEKIEDQCFEQFREDPDHFEAFMIELSRQFKKGYLDPPDVDHAECIEKNLDLFDGGS